MHNKCSPYKYTYHTIDVPSYHIHSFLSLWNSFRILMNKLDYWNYVTGNFSNKISFHHKQNLIGNFSFVIIIHSLHIFSSCQDHSTFLHRNQSHTQVATFIALWMTIFYCLFVDVIKKAESCWPNPVNPFTHLKIIKQIQLTTKWCLQN